jgi:uncharacterized protein YxjI
MDVTIQERSMSLFTEYDITAPDRTWYAKKQVFSLLHKVDLTTDGGEPVAKLQGKFAVLGDKYEFDLADGRVGSSSAQTGYGVSSNAGAGAMC